MAGTLWIFTLLILLSLVSLIKITHKVRGTVSQFLKKPVDVCRRLCRYLSKGWFFKANDANGSGLLIQLMCVSEVSQKFFFYTYLRYFAG